MRDILKLVAFFAALIVVVFGSAGRWDLPFVWSVLGILVAYLILVLWNLDPDLKRERFQPGPGGIDRHERVFMIPVALAQWILAGWDVGRHHWSDTIPPSVQLFSLFGFALALCLAFWSMMTNHFFSSVIRIQADRGHYVITDGPYHYVRHPGYLAGILSSVFGGFALGSWIAMLPVLVFVAGFLRRTIIEDRYLKAELAGYAEYAQSVRFRLLPGVW